MSNDNNNRRPQGPGRDSYGRRNVGTPGRQTRSHEYDGVVRYDERDYEKERPENVRCSAGPRPGDRYDEGPDDYIDYDSGRSSEPGRPVRPESGRSRNDSGRGREMRDVRPARNHRPERNVRAERNVRRERIDREEYERRKEMDRKASKKGGKGKSSKKAEPKKSPVKTFFKRLFIFVFIAAIVIAAAEFALTKKAYNLMTYEDVSVGDDVLSSKGVTNILLIGNDSRLGGEDGRSDAMILVSVSRKTGRILMTSILRDVYVEIPGYGHNRLNAAYSFGGPALLMETIEKNFDISVSKYMLVNFEAFANVVDAVGGIDLELTGEEVIWVDAYLNEYNELTGKEFGHDYLTQVEGGLLHLNGPQALAYSRNRYVGTDFGRTERQRKVMEQIIKKLPKAVLTNFNGLIEGLCPNLTTNMTFTEVYSLVLRGPFWLRYDREGAALPIEGSWWNENKDGMAVLGVDFQANKEYFENRLYVKDEEDDETDSENGEDVDK